MVAGGLEPLPVQETVLETEDQAAKRRGLTSVRETTPEEDRELLLEIQVVDSVPTGLYRSVRIIDLTLTGYTRATVTSCTMMHRLIIGQVTTTATVTESAFFLPTFTDMFIME